MEHFFVPAVNSHEIAVIPGIHIYPLTHFLQVVEFVQQEKIPVFFVGEKRPQDNLPHRLQTDFKDIK